MNQTRRQPRQKTKKQERLDRTRSVLKTLIDAQGMVSSGGQVFTDTEENLKYVEEQLRYTGDALDAANKGGRILNGVLGVFLAYSTYRLFQ